MSIRFIFLSIAAALLLAGCGAWQTVSDASSGMYHAVFFKQIKVLNVDLVPREALNPDDAGRSTSVVVRIYQLKDRKIFDGASYEDLLVLDRTVLGQDLLANMASVVNPGGSSSLSQTIEAETKYIAVVAFYRNADAASDWKYLIEKKKLNPDKPMRLELFDHSLVSLGGGS
ncbi:type VI secretion system lipoprotein TssJ [Herbaspirillum huttiense]|uniref:type VI secretion system lipoprotein TssJ n=1 Tax=Herbaspirillum huttiense TaxID=863372 RepID=UPI000584A4B3|nr:type VI secretion system lipoprotein TssJ [Herbaspirillum huttiense]